MKWKKLGLIFQPAQRFDWMQTHATTPVALHLKKDLFRIFFSTRNSLNQNQVGFVDLDLNDPHRIVALSEQPVLGVGQLGYFDCDGVYATSIVRVDEDLYCYYAGWNAGLRGLFYSSIGLAISNDNGQSFNRVSEAPLMGRDDVDKWAVMAPFVLKIDDTWRMWYASGISLHYGKDGKLGSFYDVKYAESADGIAWRKTGKVAIGLGDKDSNIARACVVKEDQLYRVWYPVVAKSTGQYRIGYGESEDGMTFVRKDEALEFGTSVKGWDSQAVTYPFVFSHAGVWYMLYNGNEYGKDGFGLAISE